MATAVLFHQLPPVSISQPDVALTILKGHLRAHGVPARIIYWNLSLQRFYDRVAALRPHIILRLKKDIDSRPTVFYVAPFLLELLRKEETPRARHAQASLFAYFSSLLPELAVQDPGFVPTLLDGLRADMVAFLADEVAKLELDQVNLWAISCKLNQWVPGIVLTEMATARRPDLPVVIGGIPSRSAARTMLHIFPRARCAVWGEGEGPLLSLLRQMERPDPDFASVPRLVYRNGDDLVDSLVDAADKGPLIAEDLSDFFDARAQSPVGNAPPEISINTVRGCHWARCRFCNLHQSLSHRHKDTDAVIDQIRRLATDHGVKQITFANMDIHDPNSRRFDELLDRLVAMRIEEEIDVEFTADIAATKISTAVMRKMALAGFTNLLVGFEAMTDGLLEKVEKRHRFAHNVCFLKLTDRFKIQEGVNILMGVPDETRDDVLESIQNLHYLRFYPPGRRGSLWIRPLFLGAGAPYERDMSERERARWIVDDAYSVYGFLPEAIAAAGNRMEIGAFRAPLLHPDLWEQFTGLMKAYQETRREYRWFSFSSGMILQESAQGEVIKEFTLDPESFEVLRLANDTVVRFADLFQGMKAHFPELDKTSLAEIVDSLKAEYLLYADAKLENVISVVDTDSSEGSTRGAPAGYSRT